MMEDILYFKKMLTPKIITLVYWLALAGVAVAGLGTMFAGFSFATFLMGIAIIVGGALGARIWCELLIVLFKMNEALQDIREGKALASPSPADG
jgi:hypothetical protein